MAKPESESERRALEAVRGFWGDSVYMPHVYNVVEFAAMLIERELEDHRS